MDVLFYQAILNAVFAANPAKVDSNAVLFYLRFVNWIPLSVKLVWIRLGRMAMKFQRNLAAIILPARLCIST